MKIPIKILLGIVLIGLVVYGSMVFDVFRESPTSPIDSLPTATSTETRIVVDVPARGSVISSPVTISGKARGTWYFEASFPIKIIDAEGTEIGVGYAEAQGDWMTENFVPFVATVSFNPSKSKLESKSGFIRLQRDNPSGLPENDAHIDVPVTFSVSATSTPIATCRPSGCSGEICSDQDIASNCIYREEFACYKTAECKRQSNGQCGWTQTVSLNACITSAR